MYKMYMMYGVDASYVLYNPWAMENPTEPLSTLSVAELRKNLGPAIGQVQYGGGSIEITKNGRTAAYLISSELFAKLTRPQAIETGEEN